MPKAIQCPNCDAPLEAAADQPVVQCTYCGYQIKQTMAAHQPSQAARDQLKQMLEQARENAGDASARRQQILAAAAEMQQRARRQTRVVLAVVLPIVAALSIIPVIASLNRSKRASSAGGRRSTRAGRTVAALSVLGDDPKPDEELSAKLEPYAGCISDTSRALDSRTRYLAWVDEKTGPTCQERCVTWGLYKVSPPSERCEQGLEQARSLDPRLPELEQAGDAWLKALKRVASATEKAASYYDQKDYLDDHCAKGKQLHAELLPAFAEVERADGILRKMLEHEYPLLTARRLERARQKDPHGLGATYFSVVSESRQLFELLRATQQGRRSDGDVAAARALIDRFRESVAATGRAEARLPQDEKGVHYFLFPYTFEHSSWVKSAADELVLASKEHLRRMAEPARGSAADRRTRRYSNPDETYPKVCKAYESFQHYLKGAGPTPLPPFFHTRCN